MTEQLQHEVARDLSALAQGVGPPRADLAVQVMARGRTVRRRRRILAASGLVCSLGLGAGTLLVVTGGPAHRQQPTQPMPTLTITPTPTSSHARGRTTRVDYPGGVSVFWPAAGAGYGWIDPSATEEPATDAGRRLREAVLNAVPGTQLQPQPDDGSAPGPDMGINQLATPARGTTSYSIDVDDVDGIRRGALSVWMSRGGLPTDPGTAAMDLCGSWPLRADGVPDGPSMLDGEGEFKKAGLIPHRCSVHAVGGLTVVHMEAVMPSTNGRGPARDKLRVVFTVRDDGTAVRVDSNTHIFGSLQSGPQAANDLAQPRPWSDLESLAVGLPYPE